MLLVLPTVISAQLGTLPDPERDVILFKLHQLALDPGRLSHDVAKGRSDATLWTIRLSGRMLALVHAEDNQLRVLAVAPRDQLIPYLEPKGQQAA